jgi:hypothetical protein
MGVHEVCRTLALLGLHALDAVSVAYHRSSTLAGLYRGHGTGNTKSMQGAVGCRPAGVQQVTIATNSRSPGFAWGRWQAHRRKYLSRSSAKPWEPAHG